MQKGRHDYGGLQHSLLLRLQNIICKLRQQFNPPCLVCFPPQVWKIPRHQWRSPLRGAINHHEEGEGTADARGEHHTRYKEIPRQTPRNKTQYSVSKRSIRRTHKHTKSRFSSQPDQKQDKLFGTIKEKASKALSYDSNHRQEAFQPSRD